MGVGWAVCPSVSKPSPEYPLALGGRAVGRIEKGEEAPSTTVPSAVSGIFQWGMMCRARELGASESVPLGYPWEGLTSILDKQTFCDYLSFTAEDPEEK